MNDRIKLAEAMGWEPTSSYTNVAGEVEVTRWRTPDGVMGQRIEDLPDPFTDANDDYVVLEWMRDRDLDDPLFLRFSEMVHRSTGFSHQVGDYARAALKVIDDKDNDAMRYGYCQSCQKHHYDPCVLGDVEFLNGDKP